MKKIVLLLSLMLPALALAKSTGNGNAYIPGGVTQLIAGTNVTLSPTGGTGAVTITASSTAATSFAALTSATNTTAAMLCGTGCSIGVSGTGTITATTIPVTGVTGLATNMEAFLAGGTLAQLNTVVGQTLLYSGGALGTPASATLTNATGLPIAGISGLGTGMSTFLGLAWPTLVASDCLTNNVTALSWGACGSGGSSAFNAITTGTNTTATMTVGTGGTLTYAGSGIVNADQVLGVAFPALVASDCLAVNSGGTSLLFQGCGGLSAVANQTVLGNGSGASATPVALTLGGNLVATSTGLSTSQAINTQTGTTYTICAVAPCSAGRYTGGGPNPTDAGSLVTFNNASAVAVTLPQATTTGLTAGFSCEVYNYGAGTVTITPTTSTIGGAATLTIAQNTGCTVSSDGTNYQLSACTAKGGSGSGTVTSITAGTGLSGGTITTTGTISLNLANANTWTAAQTFTNSDLLLLGSSTGATTFTSANASATAYTVTVPAATDTLAELAATQTLTNKTISGANNTLSNIALSSLAAQAANTVVMNATAGSASPTAVATVSYLLDAGTTFTLGTGTGACATTSTLKGGSATGEFLCTGTAGASTIVVNLPTATNGWACWANDDTSKVAWAAGGSTTSAITLSGAIATTSDKVTFGCRGH